MDIPVQYNGFIMILHDNMVVLCKIINYLLVQHYCVSGMNYIIITAKNEKIKH